MYASGLRNRTNGGILIFTLQTATLALRQNVPVDVRIRLVRSMDADAITSAPAQRYIRIVCENAAMYLYLHGYITTIRIHILIHMYTHVYLYV